MLLVSVCPGGNLSNFAAQVAKGNTALSITLSTSSTLLSSLSTPFLFAFFASQYAPAANLLNQIEIQFIQMLKLIMVLIAIPLVLGMLVNHFFPKIAQRLHKIMTLVSILFFGLFVVMALHQNSHHLFTWFTTIFYLVVIMNVAAYLLGFSISKIFKLPLPETKTITLETGIQNSGLGMILVVNFFNGMGGMMLVAAFWGIWHIISSLTLAWFWKKQQ